MRYFKEALLFYMVCLNCDPAAKDAQSRSCSSNNTFPIDLLNFMKSKNYLSNSLLYLLCQVLYFFLKSKTEFKVVLI